MTDFHSWARGARALAVAAALAFTGCGGSDPATPAGEGGLSEQEKQQLRELDAQRQQEWGKTR